jgi:hypothetical protein
MSIEKYTKTYIPNTNLCINHNSQSEYCIIKNISVKTTDIKYIKNIKLCYPCGQFGNTYQILDELLNDFTESETEFTQIPFNCYPLYYGPYYHHTLQINCIQPITIEYEVQSCENTDPKNTTIFVNRCMTTSLESSGKMRVPIYAQITNVSIKSSNIKSAKIITSANQENLEYNLTLYNNNLWKLENVLIDTKNEDCYLIYDLFDPSIIEDIDIYFKHKQILGYENGLVGFRISVI